MMAYIAFIIIQYNVKIGRWFYFNQNGNSALYFATMTEKTEVVKLLIDARIDLNLQEKVNEFYITPTII